MIKIHYNVQAQEKKRLIKIVEQIEGCKARYLAAPSFAYEIGPWILTRTGILQANMEMEPDSKVLDALEEAGFVGEVEFEEDENPPTNSPIQEYDSIAVPRDGMTDVQIENLKRIVEAKKALIKKALDAKRLPIEVSEDQVVFYWFSEFTRENLYVYTQFISALCKLAKETKKVTMKNKPVENEAYAWRCFLLRLGMIGPEFKETRKVLMKNFSGSSSRKKVKV